MPATPTVPIHRLARDAGVAARHHISPHDIPCTTMTGILDAANGNIERAQRLQNLHGV
ncbi:hypothetical protein ABH920_001996 [Catenulispora sp. EB89]|uniref:hypothetical protein n=1 Tax=Catenulispora sp. EB89 TaxID=3156257 RepID=UPI00351648FA